LFTSSVASAQSWDNLKGPFPEEVQLDPSVGVGAGYGEGKYTTERVSHDAITDQEIGTDVDGQIIVKSGLHATSLRIGQIVGGHGGSWATTDWFPIIVKSSIALGALPEAAGVSDPIDPIRRCQSCMLMNDSRACRGYARKTSRLPFWRRRLAKRRHRPH
jgi:thioester reductase-like protein